MPKYRVKIITVYDVDVEARTIEEASMKAQAMDKKELKPQTHLKIKRRREDVETKQTRSQKKAQRDASAKEAGTTENT